MIIYFGIKIKNEDGSWGWDQDHEGRPFLFTQSKEQIAQMVKGTMEFKKIKEYKVAEYSRNEKVHATPAGLAVEKIEGNIYSGNWKCLASPTKKCQFNVVEDPACDECIYCGEPEERF